MPVGLPLLFIVYFLPSNSQRLASFKISKPSLSTVILTDPSIKSISN